MSVSQPLSRERSNFGDNITLRPQHAYTPRSEVEVLEILARHAGESIRAIGRLHCWSEAIVAESVLLDLRYMNQVVVVREGEDTVATVGAGCQVKRLLDELNDQAGVTLPSLGLIDEQAIAGAISTGTHGSGKHSLSHYVAEVRLATYDRETGEPVIVTLSEGNELRAARCSMGLLGVIVSVKFRCRDTYRVEECARRYDQLEDVLAAEAEYPLQQFFLFPWDWRIVAQHRRESSQPRSWHAPLYRLYWSLGLDVGMHVLIVLLARAIRSAALIKWVYRWILPNVAITGWRVVDHSRDMLTMQHELFRHIEIEMFVRREQLPEAISYVREILSVFAGDLSQLSTKTRQRLTECKLLADLEQAAGCYTHHYVICVRRVLADDTLISMASADDGDCYALSFICYANPTDREGFFRFARFLSCSMVEIFAARPHWGKVCPLNFSEAARLYPHLPEFREICQRYDPDGRFRNSWLGKTLFPD